jgi:hypothetical protein
LWSKYFLQEKGPIGEEAIPPQLNVRAHHLYGVEVIFLVVRCNANHANISPIHLDVGSQGSLSGKLEIASMVRDPV